MKNQLLFILLIAWPLCGIAQIEKGARGTLSIVVKQNDKSPVAFEEISLVNVKTNSLSKNYTDKNGYVLFQVLNGNSYSVNFRKAKNFSQVKVEFDKEGLMSYPITFNSPTPRKLITMDTIWQNRRNIDGSYSEPVAVQVINPKTGSIRNLKTVLIPKESTTLYASYTDSMGLAHFFVPYNTQYLVCVEKHFNTGSLTTGKQEQNETVKKTVAYDPDRTENHGVDPYMVANDTIVQRLTAANHAGAGESVVSISIVNMKSVPIPNMKVRLVCKTVKRLFIAGTDKNGVARFIVPADKTYQVGFDNNDDIDHFTIPKVYTYNVSLNEVYEPTHISETRILDTIRQKLPADVHGTTSRSYYQITVKDYDGNFLAKEAVYLKEASSSTVYMAVTNSLGVAKLLVPKGKKYVVNFKYESSADLLDIPKDNKFHCNNQLYTYRGTESIQYFYSHAERDEKGFFKSFMTSNAKTIDVSDKQFAERTESGNYKENMSWNSPVSTPALADNEMITNEGYYSHNLYGFNPKTGHTDWGVSLAEDGASNAVYDDGVVIVNTESCTLYAIDSKTGKLLWSHWLSNYLYTTPSIDHGKIYTVYCNDLSAANGTHSYVLACFDLHKGDIIWQNWLNDNAMASPVIDHGRVYVTTFDGKLSLFNEKDGSLLMENCLNATTNPLVMDKKLFISAHTSHGFGKDSEIVYVLDANTLSVIKKCESLSARYHPKNILAHSTLEDMNYTGSRMVNYKDLNYNIMGDKLLCSNPDEGTILWDFSFKSFIKDTSQAFATMPIIAGGRIIIGTAVGKILVFDPISGRLIKDYSSDGNIIWTQPMVHNGWIYAATHEGKLISIDTHDPAMTGWDMWNYRPGHNTAISDQVTAGDVN